MEKYKPRSLTAQLIGLMSLALFPLGLVAMYQTAKVISEAERLSQVALLGETQRSASLERELMHEALGAAQGLGATFVATRYDEAVCDTAMREFIETHPQFILAGMVEADGILRCASTDENADVSATPSAIAALENPRPRFEVSPDGNSLGVPALVASHPVYDRGNFLGVMSISIPLRLASTLLPDPGADGGLKLVAVNGDGRPIAGSRGIETAEHVLPPGLTIDVLRDRVDDTFKATSADGQERFYAINEMVPGGVLLIGTWPVEAALRNQLGWRVWTALGFPVLMWIAGVVVAYLGVQQLVVRHVRSLRDGMRRFALGERQDPFLELRNPPEEIAEAERAFNRMAHTLMKAEHEAEENLQQKTVLLREVHHRVKNNLQMIVSIMNMQARNVTTPEAEEILAELQRRVRGLATIHRSLYTTTDMVTVDARALIEKVASELVDLGTATDRIAPNVSMQLEELQVYPDQAVPLSMLVSEAVTNAVKYAGMATQDSSPMIDISLGVDDNGLVTLAISNSLAPRPAGTSVTDDTDSTGLGSRLMRAFIIQLEGRSNVETTEAGYKLTITFQRQDFDSGEQRLSGRTHG